MNEVTAQLTVSSEMTEQANLLEELANVLQGAVDQLSFFLMPTEPSPEAVKDEKASPVASPEVDIMRIHNNKLRAIIVSVAEVRTRIQ